MRLPDWTRDLARRGITVTAPTTAVPVDLWALTDDGLGLHLRCRGTRVRLEVWARADLRRVVVAAVVDLPGHPAHAEHLVDVDADPNAPLLVPAGARPVATAEVDGARRFGWTGCEAGRLSVSEAAGLLDELMDGLRTGVVGVSPSQVTDDVTRSARGPRLPLPEGAAA